MEARLHLPARDRVQGPRQPVAEAVAHLAAIQRFGASLAVGVHRQVLLERLDKGRNATIGGPFPSGVDTPGDASQQLLGATARLVGRNEAVTADDDAPVGRLPSAASDAVVDDERLRTRGLDAHPEPDEPVVPRDPGRVGGLEIFDRALGQGQLDFGDPLLRSGFHDALRVGLRPEVRSTQRQHAPPEARTVGNTGESVSEGTASTHR